MLDLTEENTMPRHASSLNDLICETCTPTKQLDVGANIYNSLTFNTPSFNSEMLGLGTFMRVVDVQTGDSDLRHDLGAYSVRQP